MMASARWSIASQTCRFSASLLSLERSFQAKVTGVCYRHPTPACVQAAGKGFCGGTRATGPYGRGVQYQTGWSEHASRVTDYPGRTQHKGKKGENLIMANPEVKPAFGKELQAMTDATGAALVRFGERTFVVVEVEREPVQAPAGVYQVTDPDEIADLRDAMDDQENPSYSTAEALEYLRKKRANHGRSEVATESSRRP